MITPRFGRVAAHQEETGQRISSQGQDNTDSTCSQLPRWCLQVSNIERYPSHFQGQLVTYRARQLTHLRTSAQPVQAVHMIVDGLMSRGVHESVHVAYAVNTYVLPLQEWCLHQRDFQRSDGPSTD